MDYLKKLTTPVMRNLEKGKNTTQKIRDIY